MANIIRITRFYGKDGLMNDTYCVDYDTAVTRNYKTWKTFTIKGEMCKQHFNFIMNATSRTEYKNGVKYREVYEQHTSEEQIESIMLCDADGNEIYLTNTVADMCRYIQENHKNIIGNVYIAYGKYNTKTKYFERNDYSEYVDFVEMFAVNFTIPINVILGTDDTIVNSYSGTEEQTDKQTEKTSEYPARMINKRKELINSVYGMSATSNYDGVTYPEKEDCKTCIWRSDCKHKLTYQFNDTCEMYQPVSLYL